MDDDLDIILNRILTLLLNGDIQAKSENDTDIISFTEKFTTDVFKKDSTTSLVNELIALLKELQTQGFVEWRAGAYPYDQLNKPEYHILRIRITIKGRMFILDGGFEKKKSRQKTKDNTQRLINFALIFGGLSAGAYYITKGLYWFAPYLHNLFSCHR